MRYCGWMDSYLSKSVKPEKTKKRRLCINFTMNEMNAISFRSVNPSNVMSSIAAFEYEFIHSKGGDVLVNRYIWI